MLPLSSQKYEQNRDMSLRITVITLRDLGPYTCQAYNGKGRATSNTVTLLAVGPVSISTDKDREYLPYLVQPSPAPVEPQQPIMTPEPTTYFPGVRPGDRFYTTSAPHDPQGLMLCKKCVSYVCPMAFVCPGVSYL